MKKRFGFTLIEVAIFLAVTGALFAAITVGVQNSIYQQRYNDTVQSFADFLRNLYSEVSDVQNASESMGRSGKAIYGKMAVFGEGGDGDKQVVTVYTVVGDAVSSAKIGDGDTLGLLSGLNANVFVKGENDKMKLAGIVENYTPKWSARVQSTESQTEDFKGTLLVVRNPKTGIIQTFAMNEVIVVNVDGPFGEDATVFKEGVENGRNYLKNGFKSGNVDFCVNPNGNEASNNRTDVRVLEGARSAADVVIVPFDSADNRCNGNG